MNSPSQELLPCPFCGSHEIKVVNFAGYEAHCENCGSQGPWMENKQQIDPSKEVITGLWNTRAQQPTAPGGEVVAQALEKAAGIVEGRKITNQLVDQLLAHSINSSLDDIAKSIRSLIKEPK